MARCSFCGKEIPEDRGKMFIKNTGQIMRFCSSKCEKNSRLGREGKKTRWTETFRKGKEERA